MQIAARRVGRKVMLTCASSLSGILGNPVGPERPLDTGFVTASPLQIQITSLPPATLTLTGPGAHQALIWLGLIWPHWHGLAPSCWHGLATPHRGLRLHQPEEEEGFPSSSIFSPSLPMQTRALPRASHSMPPKRGPRSRTPRTESEHCTMCQIFMLCLKRRGKVQPPYLAANASSAPPHAQGTTPKSWTTANS